MVPWQPLESIRPSSVIVARPSVFAKTKSRKEENSNPAASLHKRDYEFLYTESKRARIERERDEKHSVGAKIEREWANLDSLEKNEVITNMVSEMKHNNTKQEMDDNREKFRCEFPNCNRSFDRANQLKRHIQLHPGGSRFVCDVCKKCFESGSKLEDHSRLHTGEKPFECHVCRNKFRYKGDRTKHLKKLHGIPKSVEGTNTSSDTIVPGHSFNPKEKCLNIEELRPQPIIRKRKKTHVPEHEKDKEYWEKRSKNTEATKRARDAKRLKDNQIIMRAAFLETENKRLIEELAKVALEREILREKLNILEKSPTSVKFDCLPSDVVNTLYTQSDEVSNFCPTTTAAAMFTKTTDFTSSNQWPIAKIGPSKYSPTRHYTPCKIKK